MKRVSLFLMVALLIAAAGKSALAATKTWTGTGGDGLWMTAANWSGGTLPATADDVVLDNTNVGGNYTVTLSAATAQTVRSLQVGYAGNANTITLVVGGSTVNVLTVSGGGATALQVTTGGVLSNQSANATRGILLSASTDVFKMSGNATYIHATSVVGSNIPQRTSGTTSSNYDFATTSVFELQTSTFDATPNYGTFKYNVNATRSASVNLTLSGDLLIAQGTFGVTASGTNTFTIGGGVAIASGATLRGAGSSGGNATMNIAGSVTGAGTFQGSASGATTNITVGGDITSIISLGSGTNTLTFSGGGASVSFTPANATTPTVQNVTISNGKIVALGRSINVDTGASVTISSGGQLNCGTSVIAGSSGSVVVNGTLGVGSTSATDAVGGNVTAATLTLNSGSTVEFNGAAAQNAGARAFDGLKINNANGITLKGSITVNATLTLTTGALSIGANTLTINNAVSTVAGSLNGGGASNISIGGAGSAASTTLPSVALNNLTLNRANGISLGGAVSVSGTLTLTSGNVSAGANTLALGAAATISRTSGHVIGALKKTAVAGTFTFTVGTASGYTPLDVANATGGGDLTVRAVASAQPNVNASTSLKEYWSLTAAGSLTADMTFNYLQTDVQGDESKYRIIRVSSGTPISFPPNCPNICVDTLNNQATIKSVSSFSDWTLGQTVAPTAVKMGAARAESYAQGVLLSWESGREFENLGFNVYREMGGRLTRVNRSLIAGSALRVGVEVELRAGESYRWWDAGGSAAARYWIEDVDLDGRRTMHGAFVPSAGKGDAEKIAREFTRSPLLSELNEKAQSRAGIFESSSPATSALESRTEVVGSVLARSTGNLSKERAPFVRRQWEIAGARAIKIAVKHDGWYRVTRAELSAAGLDADADARLLQLYCDGEQQPIRVNGSLAGVRGEGSIEFYGHGLDTPTADTRIYYLVVGTETGLRIAPPRNLKRLPDAFKQLADPLAQEGTDEAVGEPDAAASVETKDREAAQSSVADVQSFDYTFELKERLIYFSSLLNGDAENYFGRLVGSQSVTETLTARNLAATDDARGARLEVALQGVSATAHAVRIFFNDADLGTLTFDARAHAAETFDVPAALLREGANSVRLSTDGADSDLSLVDYLRLTYAHKYTADANRLRLMTTAKGALSIESFTAPNVRVLDVTDTRAVFELAPRIEATDGAFTARVQTSNGRVLLAFTDDLSERAASVSPNRPSSWHDAEDGADMIIIAHASLLDSVAPLKALRESQGLRVSVVDVEDLYDEFSFGAHTPQAVRDFLQWTTTHWQRAPRYVLLVGDATIDPRDYEGRGSFDLVPTKLVDTASMETASDEWLADFGGAGVADMSLGRLPARTSQEAATVVSKIVNFTPDAVSRSALLVSDQSGADDLDFAAASRAVGAQLPAGTDNTFINRADGSTDAVRARVIEGINAGPSVVNFMGHGSSTNWTGAGLLRSSDADALTNGDRLPLFVSMTCLNGYYVGTAGEGLAESLLKAQQGGAIAVWASSGVTIPVDQQRVNEELYRQLFGAGQPVTLGEAVRRAKLLTQDPEIRRTWILFGDPSMRLR